MCLSVLCAEDYLSIRKRMKCEKQSEKRLPRWYRTWADAIMPMTDHFWPYPSLLWMTVCCCFVFLLHTVETLDCKERWHGKYRPVFPYWCLLICHREWCINSPSPPHFPFFFFWIRHSQEGWELSQSRIFSSLDGFVQRCTQLLEVNNRPS